VFDYGAHSEVVKHLMTVHKTNNTKSWNRPTKRLALSRLEVK